MQQVYERIAGVLLRHRDGDFGRRGGCSAMPQPVDDGEDHSIFNGTGPMPVTGYGLSRHGGGGCAPLKTDRFHFTHILTVTSVPCPNSDSMANSSINRLTPGSPRPNPPDVE